MRHPIPNWNESTSVSSQTSFTSFIYLMVYVSSVRADFEGKFSRIWFHVLIAAFPPGLSNCWYEINKRASASILPVALKPALSLLGA